LNDAKARMNQRSIHHKDTENTENNFGQIQNPERGRGVAVALKEQKNPPSAIAERVE